VLSFI
jgi:E3 ubiquitin-protein ligase RNFT1